ncbi:hypothetical protein [uncultured Pseudodesulfovibrio sp.]|uniref:hypothetical protein n=1 Tax=uncultured Pseudodesulfovibrio sp. TaxID=2035858 RepID=UPI0029C92445|nr:hypothetical protein [uncultured Pseudodesulfovibrio sp.]
MKYCNSVQRHLLCLLVAVVTVLSSSPAWCQNLNSLFKEAASGGRFAMPTHKELAEARLLFELLLAGEKDTKAFCELLESLHMEMVPVQHEGRGLTVIREKTDRKRGRGFYVYNADAAGPACLMAPHSFTDILTGRIALKLAGMGGFTLTAFNTMKRYGVDGDVKLDQDMAHLRGTYFTALSHAIAALTNSPRVIQLHGYGQEYRSTPEGREADIIVSSGQRLLLAVAKQVSDCLSADNLYITRTYPDEVGELGGTTNVTGRILRKAGQKGFIHMELSRPVRTRLNRELETLQRFNRCLTDRQ